jgi:hypothetical protein
MSSGSHTPAPPVSEPVASPEDVPTETSTTAFANAQSL